MAVDHVDFLRQLAADIRADIAGDCECDGDVGRVVKVAIDGALMLEACADELVSLRAHFGDARVALDRAIASINGSA